MSKLNNLIKDPYDPYEYDTQNVVISPISRKLEPIPEVADHYFGAEILLPRGDQMARGHVVAWSHDANRNVMDKSYANPILDTRMYEVRLQS